MFDILHQNYMTDILMDGFVLTFGIKSESFHLMVVLIMGVSFGLICGCVDDLLLN